MPDGVDSSLYSKLQTQPQNPLQTVNQIGQASNALAPLVVGRAMQGAIDPATGQVDQNRLLSSLQQSPVGAANAIPTMDALQKLRQAGYAADQAGLETFQKRMATVYHLFSPLASKPNPTMDDVYDVAAAALDPNLEAHKYGITMPVVMNAIKQFRGLNPQQIKEKALQIQTQAANTSDILEAHAPRYEWVDNGQEKVLVPTGTKMAPAMGTAVPKQLPPETPVATPAGPRYLGSQPPVPGGGAVTGSGQPAIPGATAAPVSPALSPTGPAAGLPPGFSEAAQTIAGASAGSANRLTEANDTSMGRKALLGNLEDLVGKFTPGKGADWTLVAKNFANRNLPVPKSWQESGGSFDLGSVASQEEFNKQAMQLAQQQFASIGGTGTDAKFNSAFETSPNEALSKLGNVGIIRLLKGNEDAIQAKNAAWQRWLKQGQQDPVGHGPQSFAQFSQDFNSHFDPRVFQFKYVPAKERQAYVDGIQDPQEKARFLHDIAYARKQGWVNFTAK